MPELFGALFSAQGDGVQNLFGQCPNAQVNNLRGASLVKSKSTLTEVFWTTKNNWSNSNWGTPSRPGANLFRQHALGLRTSSDNEMLMMNLLVKLPTSSWSGQVRSTKMYTANGYIPCGGRVPAPLDCNYPPYQAKVTQILKERCKVKKG